MGSHTMRLTGFATQHVITRGTRSNKDSILSVESVVTVKESIMRGKESNTPLCTSNLAGIVSRCGSPTAQRSAPECSTRAGPPVRALPRGAVYKVKPGIGEVIGPGTWRSRHKVVVTEKRGLRDCSNATLPSLPFVRASQSRSGCSQIPIYLRPYLSRLLLSQSPTLARNCPSKALSVTYSQPQATNRPQCLSARSSMD
jgi:hypothetical protein